VCTGAPLRIAVEVGNRWRLHNARQPLRFVDRELFPLVRPVRVIVV
jgi:hypothetical protein